MEALYSVNIEQEFVVYNPLELVQWRLRNPEVVPQHILDKKGHGVANGYMYGEFFMKRHLENEGLEVIANDFNLFSNKSKFRDNNKRIEEVMGSSNFNKLQIVFNNMYAAGIKIENPDLCILKPNLIFADVKKDKDKLRKPQDIFAIIIWELLKIPFKVYEIIPDNKTKEQITLVRSHLLPNEYFG